MPDSNCGSNHYLLMYYSKQCVPHAILPLHSNRAQLHACQAARKHLPSDASASIPSIVLCATGATVHA
jgi:hypothetical protein